MVLLDLTSGHCILSFDVSGIKLMGNASHPDRANCCPEDSYGQSGGNTTKSILKTPVAAPQEQNQYREAPYRRALDPEAR